MIGIQEELIAKANNKRSYNYSPHINEQVAARMQRQNRFKTGLDIAKYTAAIMRRDMAAYDMDNTCLLYTSPSPRD